MNHKELKIKAATIGVPQTDIDTLKYNELKKAVKAREQRIDLEAEAQALAIDPTDLDDDTLFNKVLDAKKLIGALEKAEKLGIEIPEGASLEEIEALIAEAQPAETKTYYEAKNGNKYVFKKNALKRFNYMGKSKTQKEWLNDAEAMEALVGGNSSLIKMLKK